MIMEAFRHRFLFPPPRSRPLLSNPSSWDAVDSFVCAPWLRIKTAGLHDLFNILLPCVWVLSSPVRETAPLLCP
jgi:hypothetical protein